MNKIFLISICIFIASCSIRKQNNQDEKKREIITSSIINGALVPSGNLLANSVVGIFSIRSSVMYSSCTGTILNEQFILTAAHCLDGKKPKELLINFSLKSLTFKNQSNPRKNLTKSEIKKTFETRKVKSFRIHPDYDSEDNDFAIIMLEDKIPSHSRPVTLMPKKYLILAENKTTLDGENLSVTLMGFGITSEDPYIETEALRTTTVPGRFENQYVITDQSNGSGGCNGDSGGPAFIELEGVTYQVGVTHGPHAESESCIEEGEWMNPGLDKNFIERAQKELLAEKKSRRITSR